MEISKHQSQSPSSQPRLPPNQLLNLPKSDSQVKLLMELIAISGEYPANNIHRIIPSQSYAKKAIASLIADRLLKQVNKGGVRGYRLELKAKRQLLSENRVRYKDYLEGATDTNKQRSDHPRRLRLHSVAEVYTLMLGAKVQIFKDLKPRIYQFDEPAISLPSNSSQSPIKSPELKITTPCFYSSREQKGEDDKAIRGSRAVGTLLTPTHVFAVYNTGNTESQWYESVEARYNAEVQAYICRKRLLTQYKGEAVGGIMIGENLDILHKYLTAETKTGNIHDFFAKIYQPFYFITNDQYGEALLRILNDNDKITELISGTLRNYLPHNPKHHIEHDAMTTDGNPVLFCFLLNIPRLVKFKTGIHLYEETGRVITFDFQEDILRKYLGEGVEIKTLNLKKLMTRFFPN